MCDNDFSKIKDPEIAALLSGSFVALKRAAKIARDIAIQTNTGIVIMGGSEIVHLSSEELKEERE